jgi:hypothetical protein
MGARNFCFIESLRKLQLRLPTYAQYLTSSPKRKRRFQPVHDVVAFSSRAMRMGLLERRPLKASFDSFASAQYPFQHCRGCEADKAPGRKTT